MKRLAMLAIPALAVLVGPMFASAQAPPKKGPNEAALRQMEMAATALEAAVVLLDEREQIEARKILRQVVNHAHKAGRILLGEGPTESQRRGIALVLQGTLEVERAIELVDEARLVYRENWKVFQKAEKEAFQLARAERKAELEASLAEARAAKEAAELAEAEGLESEEAAPGEEGVAESVDGTAEGEESSDDDSEEDDDEGDEGDDEEDEEEEPEYFDPEFDALLARAEHAAREGLEQLARGIEVFPRRF
ncbi:MAG: hypothetical protein VYE73_15835 [Acidobacteriota bacterium]|nr:hypothetical protein [Acidobacteriota bacterium]